MVRQNAYGLLLALSTSFRPVESFQSTLRTAQVSAMSQGCPSMSVGPSQSHNRRCKALRALIDDDDDDNEDDDEIDLDSLGDWRNFRRTLSEQEKSSGTSPKLVSEENEQLLRTQSESLADEYVKGVWAHATSTVEAGGLVVRMPLEVEIFRNHDHSAMGSLLRKKYDVQSSTAAATWYKSAQKLLEDQMLLIAERAGEDGQVDAGNLKPEEAEMLAMYLDNQETWQEVCLVLERDDNTGSSSTVVLNRPMSMKLTDSLGKIVHFGALQADGPPISQSDEKNFRKFMMAFGPECAVYVGGPDHQDKPAQMIHGIPDLEGAVEVSPGSGIYIGGVSAAVQGVLDGKLNPLDFRFFVGRHSYRKFKLDLGVVLGKYQPVACARTLALKQCISLPKPLWHEILEVCEGELAEISKLEKLKRQNVQFQIVEEGDIEDELDELNQLDDDDLY